MAAAVQQQPASVPLEPLPLPKELYRDGARLDGRSNEEFRSICA
jgi:exosome complex RNA-binding protein Rrp42 (RNase PH superfamily)